MNVMNRQRLSDWVKREVEAGLSLSELGRRVGITSQSLSDWRDQKVGSLRPDKLQALATYRNQTVEQVCYWLDVPPPADAGLVGDVDQLTDKLKSMEARLSLVERDLKVALKILDSVTDKVSSYSLRPSALAIALQDELFEKYYDLRERKGQQKFLEAASQALENDKIQAQKVMLQIIGVSPIEDTDYPVIAQIMRAILGPKWTMLHLVQLADKMPTD
ncbi:MAG: helix-turn-helix domain-containing protein [Cyanobacteria bacterium P01_H01_bin.152]